MVDFTSCALPFLDISVILIQSIANIDLLSFLVVLGCPEALLFHKDAIIFWKTRSITIVFAKQIYLYEVRFSQSFAKDP